MKNYKNLSLLRKYVATKKKKDEIKLKEKASEWLQLAAKNRLTYEIDWLGIPVIQTPEELVLMQELIFKIKPDFIIETGVAHGGSLIFYASLMELLGTGRVIGVEIEMRKHNLKVLEKHPLYKRIEVIEANSITKETIQKIKKKVKKNSKTIVCLDSCHLKPHVLKELRLYEPLVNKGSYLVVFDTFASLMAQKGCAPREYINNGPAEAITEFLKTNKNFAIDKSYNKLFISYSPNGYLKRVK